MCNWNRRWMPGALVWAPAIIQLLQLLWSQGSEMIADAQTEAWKAPHQRKTQKAVQLVEVWNAPFPFVFCAIEIKCQVLFYPISLFGMMQSCSLALLYLIKFMPWALVRAPAIILPLWASSVKPLQTHPQRPAHPPCTYQSAQIYAWCLGSEHLQSPYLFSLILGYIYTVRARPIRQADCTVQY